MRIDISFAEELIQNYTTNHWATLNKDCPSLRRNPTPANVQDSQSVWFSLQQLKHFIHEFEGAADEDQLGVRIYFGEYSADQLTGESDNPDYTGLHTLIMLPTLLGEDGYNHDFDPETGSSDFSESTSICAMNHGTLIPPPWQDDQNVGQDFLIFCETNS